MTPRSSLCDADDLCPDARLNLLSCPAPGLEKGPGIAKVAPRGSTASADRYGASIPVDPGPVQETLVVEVDRELRIRGAVAQ